MNRRKGLILGGGPTGLSVATAFGEGCIVLEKEDRVGGLCRSINRQGAVFDIGGHSFHTPHPEVRELVTGSFPGEGLFLQKRDARVHFGSRLIPYPFQKHFDQIDDPKVVQDCQEGLEQRGANTQPATNFEEFIVGKFGAGIARHFMLPYNRKLWARDISTISCEWTSERVAGAKGESEKFDLSGGKRKPLQSDTRVGYPPKGGFEEIFLALSKNLADVRTGKEIHRICPRRRTAWTKDGESFDWSFLVSTAPLPELLRMIDGVPEELVGVADSLPFMSLRVELITVDGPPRSPLQRIYVHDPEIPPHKIAFNHNSSDSLRAAPRQAIMAETSLSADKAVDVSTIASKTVGLLCKLGVLGSPDDVLDVGHIDVKYGYPVYTQERPEQVHRIKDWLQRHEIYSAGRFGDWEYVNSDRCVAKGLALGSSLRETHGSGSGPVPDREADSDSQRSVA